MKNRAGFLHAGYQIGVQGGAKLPIHLGNHPAGPILPRQFHHMRTVEPDQEILGLGTEFVDIHIAEPGAQVERVENTPRR